MRIVHLTVVRQLTGGQTKQLSFEHEATGAIEDADWTTMAYHDGDVTQPFIRQIPWPFRRLFLRNLFGWITAWRLSRQYDFVMLRHMTFDPFAFVFAPLIKNRISVHHAKEIEELRLIRRGWKGRLASALERLSGGVVVRRSKVILGVTQEIAEYERKVHRATSPTGVYSNGVSATLIKLLDDAREEHAVQAAFICGTFAPWHGLDKLLRAFDDHVTRAPQIPLFIHLIGHLSNAQIADLQATEARKRTFVCHGTLAEEEYRKILNVCDVGIASLSMERQNLTEGSTLKVREMLAMGLPVYSGHRDIALPDGQAYARVVAQVSISGLYDFGIGSKSISRETIRENSLRLISKEAAMRSVVSVTSSIPGVRHG